MPSISIILLLSFLSTSGLVYNQFKKDINQQFIIGFSAIANVHMFIKGKLKLDLQPKSKLEVLVSVDRVTDFKEWLGR